LRGVGIKSLKRPLADRQGVQYQLKLPLPGQLCENCFFSSCSSPINMTLIGQLFTSGDGGWFSKSSNPYRLARSQDLRMAVYVKSNLRSCTTTSSLTFHFSQPLPTNAADSALATLT